MANGAPLFWEGMDPQTGMGVSSRDPQLRPDIKWSPVYASDLPRNQFGQGRPISGQTPAEALIKARATGQPQPIGNQGLVAYPNGNVGTPGGGFGGSITVSAPALPTSPTAQVIANALRPVPYAPAAPFNVPGLQAPAAPTPAPAPASVIPPALQGGVFGPSDTAIAARNYRIVHGMHSPQDQSDFLNEQSLAAARAGRTMFLPGPYPATGNIVANALVAPPAAPSPIMMAPAVAAPAAPQSDNFHWLQRQYEATGGA